MEDSHVLATLTDLTTRNGKPENPNTQTLKKNLDNFKIP